ncbi:MAG: ABC transporter ATP-binding protein [Vulcanimicrobiaceae bacterium]
MEALTARGRAERPQFAPNGAAMSAPLLELDGVTVLRRGRAVLADFSLTVGAHERIAIVGPNGAGKSTLLKLITRECYPVPSDATVCRIFGRELWNVRDLRTQLGIVSNDLASALEPHETVRDIVLSGYFSAVSLERENEVAADMERAAADALARLGATHLAARELGTLSSGEARRALIARALVHRPLALVFDEPTTSLDFVAQRDVRRAMRGLARDGVGIVLVTHDLADIVPEIDRVVLIRDGRIVRDGPKTQTLVPQALRELFEADVELEERDGWFHVA